MVVHKWGHTRRAERRFRLVWRYVAYGVERVVLWRHANDHWLVTCSRCWHDFAAAGCLSTEWVSPQDDCSAVQPVALMKMNYGYLTVGCKNHLVENWIFAPLKLCSCIKCFSVRSVGNYFVGILKLVTSFWKGIPRVFDKMWQRGGGDDFTLKIMGRHLWMRSVCWVFVLLLLLVVNHSYSISISGHWRSRTTRCIMVNILQTKVSLTVINFQPNSVDSTCDGCTFSSYSKLFLESRKL